jgi:hypothetical protein
MNQAIHPSSFLEARSYLEESPPMPSESQPSERRKHLRRPRPCTVSCLSDQGDDAGQWQAALIVDVSPGGVGILSDRWFGPNAVLKLRFGSDGEERTALMTHVHVVRIQARLDGKWLLGCRFAAALGDKEYGAVLDRINPGPPGEPPQA